MVFVQLHAMIKTWNRTHARTKRKRGSCGCSVLCNFVITALVEEGVGRLTLRKQAYSNIKKISPPKTENIQIKNSDIFHISAQNIDCEYSLEPPRRGGSNGYPQSMFLSKIRKKNVYPCKPQFHYIKVGLKGVI